MGDLFNREISVNIGGNVIATRNKDGESVPILRVVFSVELTLERDANTVELSVYNLKEETRSRVSQKNIRTTIEAGYVDNTSVIFDGELDYGSTRRDAADWVTEFQSTDGGDSLRKSRINESLKSGVTLEQALRRAVAATGLGIGNAIEQIRNGNIRGTLDSFSGGLVMSGSAQSEITKLLDAAGYGWSVQQGQIQVLGPLDIVDQDVVNSLSSKTGLIGSPQPGEDGMVSARVLLLPDLLPGRRVEIKSEQINGFFRVERVQFTGDTWGQDWYAEIEAKPL